MQPPPTSRQRLNNTVTNGTATLTQHTSSNINDNSGTQHLQKKQLPQLKLSPQANCKKKLKNTPSQTQAQWFYKDRENKEHKCDNVLNNIFNNLEISCSTAYVSGKCNYEATKLSPTHVEETNVVTKRKYRIYTKSATRNNNNSNSSPPEQKQKERNINNNTNRNIGKWAFVNEHNVLIEVSDEYQRFLNNLNVHENKIYGNIYSVIKLSNSHVKQQNIQFKTIRQLFRVLCKDDNNKSRIIKIETNTGEEMIKQLFFQTVDRNLYEICKIEQIKYDDQDLYFTIYNKYKKNYNGKSLERWLFHGTDTSLLTQIERNGFDRNFNKSSAYGKV